MTRTSQLESQVQSMEHEVDRLKRKVETSNHQNQSLNNELAEVERKLKTKIKTLTSNLDDESKKCL